MRRATGTRRLFATSWRVLARAEGLRPFEPDEALKFYGRETHTTELLRRLSENRFIAVGE